MSCCLMHRSLTSTGSMHACAAWMETPKFPTLSGRLSMVGLAVGDACPNFDADIMMPLMPPTSPIPPARPTASCICQDAIRQIYASTQILNFKPSESLLRWDTSYLHNFDIQQSNIAVKNSCFKGDSIWRIPSLAKHAARAGDEIHFWLVSNSRWKL